MEDLHFSHEFCDVSNDTFCGQNKYLWTCKSISSISKVCLLTGKVNGFCFILGCFCMCVCVRGMGREQVCAQEQAYQGMCVRVRG